MHKSYEDLMVWQKSIQLAKELYRITAVFPKEERYGLVSQMRRSVVSIASNIAEGCGRNNYKEFIQFLGVARGSLAELHTQLIIAKEIGYIASEDYENTIENTTEISRMIHGLKTSLKEAA